MKNPMMANPPTNVKFSTSIVRLDPALNGSITMKQEMANAKYFKIDNINNKMSKGPTFGPIISPYLFRFRPNGIIPMNRDIMYICPKLYEKFFSVVVCAFLLFAIAIIEWIDQFRKDGNTELNTKFSNFILI